MLTTRNSSSSETKTLKKTVLIVDDIADVEADPDGDGRVNPEATLDVDSGVHRLHCARKHTEGSVALELDDLTLVGFDALA